MDTDVKPDNELIELAILSDQFLAWWAELKSLAAKWHVEWLLSCKQDHCCAFLDDLTPTEELQQQLAAARAGC